MSIGNRSGRAALWAAMALAIVACSDSPTGPGEEPPVEVTGMAMSIIQGQGQAAPVATRLPEPLAVAVVRDSAGALGVHVGPQASIMAVGDPVPGVVVSFVVVDAGCGRPFAGAALTDTLGRAMELWELGQRSGECRMEARAVHPETGEAMVFDTFHATAEPGPAARFDVTQRQVAAFVGEGVALGTLVANVADQYGNPVEAAPAPVVVSAPAGVTVNGDTITATVEGVHVVRFSVGSKVDSVTVASAEDLATAGLHVAFACRGGMTRNGVAMDSAHAAGPLTVSQYTVQAGFPERRPFALTYNLTWEYFHADGTTSTVVAEPFTLQAVQVVPGGIVVDQSLWLERSGDAYVVVAPTSAANAYRSPCAMAWPEEEDATFYVGG